MNFWMRQAWSLALLPLLPGCATQSTPAPVAPAARNVAWPEWKSVPLALLPSPESEPVWYPITPSDARSTAPRAVGSGAVAKPNPAPPAPKPAPTPRRGKVTVESAEVGKSVKLEATAEGTPPFQFQWKKAGRPLPGAVHQRLQFESFTAEDAGDYVCVVSNAYGSSESHPIKLVARKP